MVIHGSISLVRCLPIVHPNFGYQATIRGTILLLGTNVVYSGIFAFGKAPTLIILKLGSSLLLV